MGNSIAFLKIVTTTFLLVKQQVFLAHNWIDKNTSKHIHTQESFIGTIKNI